MIELLEANDYNYPKNQTDSYPLFKQIKSS